MTDTLQDALRILALLALLLVGAWIDGG